ncbi:MAG: radical SAM protein [Candidatus Aminicenantes bacterium]|nr:radical SAM protein [Candidatus Aminicenantes bacterium]
MSSICEQTTGLDDQHFWRLMSARIAGQRVPFSGSLALTHRCNLGCVHCYAGEKPGGDITRSELGTGQWLKIIADIKVAGCLFLLLTGGEPLLRDDFSEIYSFARKSGFLVTVFTNGTLVSDRIIGLFQDLPPRLVEISLYGANAETHDRITGIPGSFDRALQGIEALLSAGMQVRLKSVLMTLNNEGFPAIEELARSRGIKFRFDPAIFPTLAGDRGPLDLRVAPERAVDLEMADADRVREWREFFRSFREDPGGDGLFNCGSGVNTFHVDPQGQLFPCLMVRNASYSLSSGRFQDGWGQAFNDFRKAVPEAHAPCRGCEKKLLCGYCPGFFEMENGADLTPSEYMCGIGKRRFEKIVSEAPGG